MGDLNYNLLNPSNRVILLSFCHINNLTAKHNNSPTHFDSFHRSSSLLDVFLVAREDKVLSYKNFPVPSYISKHYFIQFNYIFNPAIREKKYKIRNLDGIDIDVLLNHAMELDLVNIFRLSDVDQIAGTINYNCLLLLNCYAPYIVKRVNFSKKYKYGFMNSNEIKNMKNLRDVVYRDYKESIERSQVKWKLYCK